MTREMKQRNLNVARGLARFFQVKIEIRMFGKLVWTYVWPPDSDVDENVEPLIS